METRYTEFDTLVIRNRSCRRFQQGKRIEPQTLVDLVNVTRLCGCAGNRQALRYQVLYSEAACEYMFPFVQWGALLKNWSGPAEGERPAAYVLVYARMSVHGLPQCDAGIAMQTLLLAAVSRGVAGCMLSAIDRAGILTTFPVSLDHELLYVVALGYPDEKFVLEDAESNQVAYYRDAANLLHVPKQPLDEVLLAMK
jgi:nitroreductase